MTAAAQANRAALDAKLEPEAVAVCSDEYTAMVSIAISLKRIADVAEKGVGLTFDHDAHFHTLTNLAWEMGRSFKSGAAQ